MEATQYRCVWVYNDDLLLSVYFGQAKLRLQQLLWVFALNLTESNEIRRQVFPLRMKKLFFSLIKDQFSRYDMQSNSKAPSLAKWFC